MKLLATLSLFILLHSADASAQIAVIANKSVPLNEIKRTQLLDFYTYDVKKWRNGESVVVIDLKPKCEVKTAFYGYLGKSSSRMKSIWLKMMLSGEGDPPKALPSEDEVLQKVATTPGAIGFIGSAKATDVVKILLIIPADKKE